MQHWPSMPGRQHACKRRMRARRRHVFVLCHRRLYDTRPPVQKTCAASSSTSAHPSCFTATSRTAVWGQGVSQAQQWQKWQRSSAAAETGARRHKYTVYQAATLVQYASALTHRVLAAGQVDAEPEGLQRRGQAGAAAVRQRRSPAHRQAASDAAFRGHTNAPHLLGGALWRGGAGVAAGGALCCRAALLAAVVAAACIVPGRIHRRGRRSGRQGAGRAGR